jgi:hypothetical protein
MRDSSFKALLLSLLARRLRRWADSLSEPEHEPAETLAARSEGKVSSASATSEPAGESHAASGISSASQKSEHDHADQSLPDQLAGPPEDWLRRKPAGPPADWLERVRQIAPDLIRQEEEGEFVMTARVTEPSEPRPKPPPPLRLERPPSPPPRQAQAVGSDEPPSSKARTRGESQSGSTGRDLSSDVPRESLAGIRSQVERPSQPRPQTARQQPIVASLPGVQESSAGRETIQASRRDAISTSQTKRFASRSGERTSSASESETASQAERRADEAHTVAGKPVQFRSDRAAGELTARQTPRTERPKPLMNTAEAEEWEPHHRAETPSRQGRPSPSPVAPLRHEVVYPEMAQPEARKFQVRAETGSNSSEERRTRIRSRATTLSPKPIDPAKTAETRFAPEAASSDRWPELPEPAEYVDEMAAAWLELSRRQRLSHEQTGRIWSE